MSVTNDYYIENQPGAPFRADLNTIIAALATSNAGSSEPPNPQPGLFWMDSSSSPWKMKRRNSANTGWVLLYDSSNKPSKSDVGLGNVPNYYATSSLTDGSTSKFSTARAAKDLEDKKLDKTAVAADSSKLGGKAASSYALNNGDYSGLRARGTTKSDVGLGSVANFGYSASVTLNSTSTYATSAAVYSLNQSKLGKTEKAADSSKLGGKTPSAYAASVHSHGKDDLPMGTTSGPGILQLNNSTSSTSTSQAATPKAVKEAKEEAIAQGVPPGIITMFAGTEAQVPEGWKLCKGEGTTSNGIDIPDLRDKFIVVAGSEYPVGNTGGSKTATTSNNGAHSHSITVNSGGSHSHSVSVGSTTLSLSQIPSHNHSVTGNQVGGSLGGGWRYTSLIAGGDAQTSAGARYVNSSGSSGSHNHSASSGSAGSHSHSASSNSKGNHTHSVSTISPYYALAFVIKL